ncbi:MAG TPA: nuclear transport factor 2 family protein [Candidatus Acidoferrum sp.]|nr:nuclear transport factor 2 family protein [Candidatus Acidoferrum sp.]
MSRDGKMPALFRWIGIVALLGISFLSGWLLNGRIGVSISGVEQAQGNSSQGNASPAAREEILVVLHAFQDGYTKRDVAKIDAFMDDLFVRSDEVQLLGTDSGEWNRGFTAIEKFIRNDWTYWGNVRIDVERATISAKEDVAWVALPGRVEFASGPRPIRLTGTLIRTDGKWKFELVQFQWLDRKAGLRDLLYLRNLRVSR